MKFSQKNLENWRFWKSQFFWVGQNLDYVTTLFMAPKWGTKCIYMLHTSPRASRGNVFVAFTFSFLVFHVGGLNSMICLTIILTEKQTNKQTKLDHYCSAKIQNTGKSLSEALILASINPNWQHYEFSTRKLQVQYMLHTSKSLWEALFLPSTIWQYIVHWITSSVHSEHFV